MLEGNSFTQYSTIPAIAVAYEGPSSMSFSGYPLNTRSIGDLDPYVI